MLPHCQFERSLIVPVFNGLRFLPEFWSRLTEHVPLNSEIIIVDDASVEPVATAFRNSKDRVTTKIIRQRVNLGYAEAVNTGVKAASGVFVHVLNSDVFLTEDLFSAAERLLKQDQMLGLVGAPLYYPQNKRLQHLCVGFSDRKKRHVYRHCPRQFVPLPDLSDVQAATFAITSLKKDVWKSMGGLDTAYYNRNEDIDFCLRIKNRGYRIAIVPDAFAYHWESTSGPARFALDEENEAYFWGTWYGKAELDMERYLKTAIATAQIRHPSIESFQVIDLTRSIVDKSFRAAMAETFHLTPQDVVRRQRYAADRDILLPMTLPYEMSREEIAFLYLVDDWTQLELNALWFETRQGCVGPELIIDLNANALWSTDVF